MFDIQVCDEGARIIRDALRLYKKQWPGGHPQEQEDITFLETQFTKMVLESTIDAWPPKHGTGLRFTRYELMSNIVIRYIANAKKKADNYKVDALRYRGVVYKQLIKWSTMPAKKRAQTMQSNKVTANVTPMTPGDTPVVFKRCGQCGDKKPECRKQKKCLKGLL